MKILKVKLHNDNGQLASFFNRNGDIVWLSPRYFNFCDSSVIKKLETVQIGQKVQCN